MRAFLARFGSLIKFVLSGFDRLRLVGESRLLNNASGVDSYLFQQRIRYVNFPRHAKELTERLRRQTEKLAKAEGVPLKPLNHANVDKAALALELARAHGRDAGCVAVLSAVETCLTYRVRRNAVGWVKPVTERAKCLHYYHYFLHHDFGLCYVRVQSWFPFAVRVGLNGREWLCRQLEQRGVEFRRRDNLVLSVADLALAQELLDAQPRAD